MRDVSKEGKSSETESTRDCVELGQDVDAEGNPASFWSNGWVSKVAVTSGQAQPQIKEWKITEIINNSCLKG